MGAERRRVAGVVAGLVLALLASGCAAGTKGSGDWYGQTLKSPWPVPATELVDTQGDPFSFTGSTDKPLTLVFFGYTNCPDICSQEMADITAALLRLSEDDREQVDVVFVTTDPRRDDQEAIATYLSVFDRSYTGVTGSGAAIQDIIKGFHIFVAPGAKNEDGAYLVEHDDHTFGVVDGEVPIVWNRDTTSKGLAEDIVRLLHEEDA